MSCWRETSEGLEWISSNSATSHWVLKWTNVMPGAYVKLSGEETYSGPYLGALGITARGQGEPGNLYQSNISQIEVVRDRVEISFVPSGWHDTTVRYAWLPSGSDQFDLELQVSTRSVGKLHGVELGVVSSAWTEPEKHQGWLVSMRDESAEIRSKDGRQSSWFANQTGFELDGLVSGEDGRKVWPPSLMMSKMADTGFLETAHPIDISRRYRSLSGITQQTWTLGYPMERGVILRSRFRGRLLGSEENPDSNAINLWQSDFMAKPLPLDN